MCSMHGLPTIGTIGFGWFDVSGRRRVPSPPAMTTAFTPRTSRRAFQRYAASAARARPKPTQKMTRGHSVPLSVTIVKPSDAYSSQVAALPSKLTSNV